MAESRERFSRRVPWHLPHNPLSQAVAARRRLGLPLLDLTVSNPTAALPELYDPSLLAPLADPRGLRYEPSPQGHPEAREAVGDLEDRELDLVGDLVVRARGPADVLAHAELVGVELHRVVGVQIDDVRRIRHVRFPPDCSCL